MLSFQSTPSSVLDCMILQFSLIKSSVISLVFVSYFSNNMNFYLGQWLSHSRLGSIFANLSITRWSSSNGLNRTLIYFKLSLANCRIFRLSSEASELWLISRCSSFNALIPARVMILLWLASSFFRFLRFSNSTKFESWL